MDGLHLWCCCRKPLVIIWFPCLRFKAHISRGGSSAWMRSSHSGSHNPGLKIRHKPIHILEKHGIKSTQRYSSPG